MEEAPDPFRVLGVPPDSSWTEIKEAYRAKARLYHPDVNPGLEAWAETQMKLLNLALAMIRAGDAPRRGPRLWENGRRSAVLTAVDPFEVLGLGEDATAEELLRAYQSSVAAWHPDLNTDVDRRDGLRAVSRLDEAYRATLWRRA